MQRTVLAPSARPWGELDFGIAYDPDTLAPAITVAPGTRMTACEGVYAALRKAELASLAENDDEDSRESHFTTVRIRLATLAALLHDSTHIDESVWEWTGLLIEVHRRTLAWMEHVARDAEQAAAERRGQIRAYERSGERGESGASATRTYVGTFCRAVRAGVRWEDVAAAGCVRLEGVAASPMATPPLKTPAQCVYVQQVKTPPEVSPGPRLYLLASCTQVVRDLCPNWGPLRLQCSSADEQ